MIRPKEWLPVVRGLLEASLPMSSMTSSKFENFISRRSGDVIAVPDSSGFENAEFTKLIAAWNTQSENGLRPGWLITMG